ncbi:MAG TPA: aldo/keto reductase [Clostridia bacterium]|jgi:diketogulonate reductase-like aldo/keto reductase|nr:aldo/keto reductase [Clostridia bacterium]HPY42746.1 aldo/keto reductase [Clostridia bacterium]HQA96572.1 aldo/keto reductase [Clostridia bacterium]HQO54719.1 aldo/keto reductase [Clostridia bacterium]HUM60079.1 aldo/keto reductase [Clostridia bacterium]
MNFTLSNGLAMPVVGIGTFTMTPAQAETAVLCALTSGYRMIDTAQAYMNERAVGRAIRKSGVARGEIFLSTKIWASQYNTEGTVEKSLELLGTDYIDLMFIHQPAGDFMAGYKKLEDAYKEGKIRSIGISNFKGEKLERLLNECEIKPHVIQMEAHPYYIDTATTERLAKHGCRVMAWYPLGHGDKALLEEPAFIQLAEKYGKSTAQVILRWHIQIGNQVIPGSKNPEHIKENLDIFDFALTEGEMAQIARVNKNQRYYNATDEKVESFANFVIDLDSQE